MRIENDMLSRFGKTELNEASTISMGISQELDFFFENVMDTVVDYFKTTNEINL